MPDPLTMLQRLAGLIAAAPAGGSIAARLAQACVPLLGVDGVSITLHAASQNRLTLAVTDPVAAELERLQDVLGQGPCWDAEKHGSPQIATLSTADERLWPQFVPAARQQVGTRTIVGLPMSPHGHTIGVLSTHQLDLTELPAGIESSLLLADVVGAVLLGDQQQNNLETGDGPWSGRALVHQATGMIIAQLRVSPQDALAILRAHAFAHDTNLETTADQVLRGTLTFGKDSNS